MRKSFECDSCGAYGSITIKNDSEIYEIIACPSCAADISKPDDNESDEDYD